MKINRNNVLTGVAGEYFVAAELSRMGYIASLTLKNTQGVDLLVSNLTSSKSIGIQVKTSSGSGRHWMVNSKAELFNADNLFYVFVNLGETGQRPVFYVVPSKVVASYVKKSHAAWLITPGKRGQKHKDTPMRKFQDKDGTYLERWDLLEL